MIQGGVAVHGDDAGATDIAELVVVVAQLRSEIGDGDKGVGQNTTSKENFESHWGPCLLWSKLWSATAVVCIVGYRWSLFFRAGMILIFPEHMKMVDNDQLLFLHERGKKKLMEGNRVVFNDDSDPASYSGKIVECSWDSEKDVWVCMRIRTDKATPNDFNTYKKVMRSIRDNITEDVLLNEIHEIIRLPMYADRIHNDSKAHHHSNSARRR
ncbi:hypothetical protein TEA_014337 [Camellia sinensis var. sinensis]|uniref:mRNA capping enzyme C-terminal domain-containing protein n=1 Tax=Camellia sinensis var. sinensis TaxID=542762 RepID=A0A4S4CYT7_CAMSN|nr:hypothetical protein TEA_014337 [Camellia sinensis var. sinensis]